MTIIPVNALLLIDFSMRLISVLLITCWNRLSRAHVALPFSNSAKSFKNLATPVKMIITNKSNMNEQDHGEILAVFISSINHNDSCCGRLPQPRKRAEGKIDYALPAAIQVLGVSSRL